MKINYSKSIIEFLELQSINSNGTESTWEENWLFKTRKLKTDPQTPIAMLVPSPMDEVKAQIGDKNADETSDLSENSDTELENEMKQKDRKLKSKKLILGSFDEPPAAEPNKADKSSLEDILAPASLISTNSFSSHSEVPVNPSITEAKNNLLLMDDGFTTTKPEKPLIEITTWENATMVMNTLIKKSEISSVMEAKNEPPTPSSRGELKISENSSNFSLLSHLFSAKTPDIDLFLDHIVSPRTVRQHKKSIDEQFETLLKDDNNNEKVKGEGEDTVDKSSKIG